MSFVTADNAGFWARGLRGLSTSAWASPTTTLGRIDPGWSADSQKMIFTSRREGNGDTFVMDLELADWPGTGNERKGKRCELGGAGRHSESALSIAADIELDSLLDGARESTSLGEYESWMEKAGERALNQTIVIPLGEIAAAYGYNPDVIPEEFQIGYSLPYSNLERRLLTGEY